MVLEGHDGSAIDQHEDLWEGIGVQVRRPSTSSSASFLVELTKIASRPEEVALVEGELLEALAFLAATWSFAGGSHLSLIQGGSVMTPSFTTNSAETRKALLAEEGLVPVEASFRMNIEASAGYRTPPLRRAAVIARHCRADEVLAVLLKNYHAARDKYLHRGHSDRNSWFIDLYKVREVLKQTPIAATLRSQSSDWQYFGEKLNRGDLRHAEVPRTTPPLATDEIDRLFSIARNWIEKYLQHVGV